MANSEYEMIAKKNEAKIFLFRRIIPWAIISIITLSIIIVVDTRLSSDSKIGLGLSLFFSYIVFCIPWFIESLKKNTNRKIMESYRNKYSPNNGLEAKHMLSAFKDGITAIAITFTIMFKVPYHLIKTAYILVKK